MSRTNKRKHVMKEMFDDDFDPPKGNEQIVKIISSRGNNLHEVEPVDNEEKFLVSMPTKFRRNVYVKRGDFVMVVPIEEGDKVKAEITRILTPDHIKIFTKDGIWPKKFTKKRELEDDNNSDDDDLIKNTNRKMHNTGGIDEDSTDESNNSEEE